MGGWALSATVTQGDCAVDVMAALSGRPPVLETFREIRDEVARRIEALSEQPMWREACSSAAEDERPVGQTPACEEDGPEPATPAPRRLGSHSTFSPATSCGALTWSLPSGHALGRQGDVLADDCHRGGRLATWVPRVVDGAAPAERQAKVVSYSAIADHGLTATPCAVLCELAAADLVRSGPRVYRGGEPSSPNQGTCE